MKFVIATNNKKKLRELSKILDGLGIAACSLTEAGVTTDVEETEENALLKAKNAVRMTGLPAVADDSGLAVEELDGAPGIYSARYGGCQTDEERVGFLLQNMEGKADRAAYFVSAVACVFPDGTQFVTRGECHGEITLAPSGNGGFGYDPVFFLPEEGRTMAELSEERKNQISHRAKALAQFKDALLAYLQK